MEEHTSHMLHHFTPPEMHVITSSRQSSCSIRSPSQSLNDFLDLYADDDDDDDDDDSFEIDSMHRNSNENLKREILVQKNENILKTTNLLPKPSNVGSTSDIENKTPHQTYNLSSNLTINDENRNPVQNINSDGSTQIKFLSENITTTIHHPDSTMIANSDSTPIKTTEHNNFLSSINNNDKVITKPKTYSYQFEEGDNNGIDESILEIINNIGNEMDPNEELEIELSPETFEQLHRNNSLYGVTDNNNFDFLSLEIPSDNEDYDDPNRFKSFFGVDDVVSSNESNNTDYNDNINNSAEHQTVDHGDTSEIVTDHAEDCVTESECIANDVIEDTYINENTLHTLVEKESLDIPRDNSYPESKTPANPTDFAQGTSLDVMMPDEPPPYSLFDESHLKTIQELKDAEFALKLQRQEYTHDSGYYPTSESDDDNQERDAVDNVNDINSVKILPESSTTHIATPLTSTSLLKNPSTSTHINRNSLSSNLNNSPLKRKISIKLKKNKDGELSRHASVDYYRMDRYLPPYRSLITPNKVFDYRTNTYINATDSDIEIKSGEDNKPVVAIHKKKRDSKLMSILVTTNNNLKQKILDAASDTLSIKSRSVSNKSVSSIQHSAHSEVFKSKPTAKFNELPKEIHQMIISSIDNQHDLVTCLYVSKSFKSFAIPNLYRYPKFTSSYRLAQFVHTIMNYPDYAQYVKVFDLSRITFPVLLTPAEKSKYNDRLIYGSTSAMELLNEKNKIIHASWRDWKYRNHPVYGDFNKWRKRANSGSTISSSGSSTVESYWDLHGNQSAPNLLVTKKLSSVGSTMLNNSSNRARSHSGSENSLKKAKGRSSFVSTSNNAKSHGSSQKANNGKHSKHTSDGDSAFIKSFKKAFGLEPITPVKKKNSTTSPVRKTPKKQLTSSSSTSLPSTQKKKQRQQAPIVKEKPSGVLVKNKKNSVGTRKGKAKFVVQKPLELQPFGTPHPKMNTLLKQYCFNRDIPVGYIIHIITECVNLEELNFNNIVVSTDYELRDYESFNWATGNGKIISKDKQPIILDENKPIFWSDSGRDMDLDDLTFIKNYAKSVEFKSVWKRVVDLPNIKRLKLRKINSLELNIIESFVMHSKFKKSLKYLDCSGSGMVKRSEWDELKEIQEWREYFRFAPN